MKKISRILIVLFIIISGIYAKATTVNAAASNGDLINGKYVDGPYYVMHEKSNGSHMWGKSQFLIRSTDGQFVYCVQPFVSIKENNSYDVATEDIASILKLSQESWDKIAKIAYYGYKYNFNGYDHTSEKWYAATQMLIWKIADPSIESYFTDTNKGKRNDSILEKEQQEIMKLVDNHLLLPQFDNLPDTISVNQTITITDKRNVLENFSIDNVQNASVHKDANSLTIKAENVGSVSFNICNMGNIYGNPIQLYYAVDSQNAIRRGDLDPIIMKINFKVNSQGKIQIYKSGQNLNLSNGSFYYDKKNLENIKFIIKANEDIYSVDGTYKYYSKNDVVDEIITNKDGYAVTKLLPLGKYIVEESETQNGYILDKSKYEVELVEDEEKSSIVYADISLFNYLKKGKLEFTKTDLTTGKVIPNTKIEIYTYNDELIYSGLTDVNGKVIIDNLPVGKFYIIEKNPASGYKINDEKVYFEITEDGEIVKANMTNEKIKSTIKIHKIDEDNNSLKGVLIGIYDLNDNLIYSGLTDDEGYLEYELEYGRYYFQEISPLKGYELNTEKVFFEITKDGDYIQYTLINKFKPIKVPITELNDNSLLFNFAFIVFTILGCLICKKIKYENQ